ncbi:MAG: FKBP-type peptidyl-prolyl cis-trans isomerase [Bacteroidetes bacterium]|nr:FKBP-type peptidyl-prolyl cis-trans isomerase [Bacteroidota bacterium]
MKNKILKCVIVVGIAMIAFSSCTSKYPGFKKTKTGLYYKFHVENKDSSKAQKDEILSLRLKYSYKDSTIFDSKGEMMIPLNVSESKGDIFEGLAMMHTGDSASFIINADSFFIKTAKMPQRPPFIDSNSTLKFEVKLLSHRTKEALEKFLAKKRQDAMVKEPSRIEKYLKAKGITVTPTTSGLYFIEDTKGKGAKPGPKDYVKVHYSVSTIEGKVFYSSFKNPEPHLMQMDGQLETQGLKEGLSLMTKGSKVRLIVPSKLAFGQGNNSVEPYTPLLYEVQLVDIMSKAQYDKEQDRLKKKAITDAENAKKQEPELLKKYVSENKITVAPTASGLYYVELKKGTGKAAEKGKRVKVHYEGKLLNGKVFDSSKKHGQPFEFVLGQNQVIPGWDEALLKMKVGGKAKLILPSSLGYGAQAMPTIPAYSPLIFEVELLDVK